EGTDIVWLLDESTPATPALIPQSLKIAREGVSLKGSWQPIPSIVIEPYCLWKNLENRQDPDKKVPHEPESTIGFNLQINLLEKDNQRLVFSAEGTWRGKRYYTFSSSSVLDPSSTTSLTLTYIRKSWRAFLGVEKTDYVFSKDLVFPETRLKFGAEIKLF
ncbi:hypothetical protein H5U35_01805, partial [Candidatus Aerophobetes bacterium]|nr:hypothetical protein [Candidatus Aerophobetes bacterium]